MATDTSTARGASEGPTPDDDVTAFVNVLNELKATGCTLLVAGDATRDAFTRASGQLLGDDDVLRYRVLAVTDATPRSVADRLPESRASPRPLAETTRLLSHAGAPRSITSDGDSATPGASRGFGRPASPTANSGGCSRNSWTPSPLSRRRPTG